MNSNNNLSNVLSAILCIFVCHWTHLCSVLLFLGRACQEDVLWLPIIHFTLPLMHLLHLGHRIIELLKLEKTLSPASDWTLVDWLVNWIVPLSVTSGRFLSASGGGDSTTSLGSLFERKNSSWCPTWCGLRLCPLVLFKVFKCQNELAKLWVFLFLKGSWCSKYLN